MLVPALNLVLDLSPHQDGPVMYVLHDGLPVRSVSCDKSYTLPDFLAKYGDTHSVVRLQNKAGRVLYFALSGDMPSNKLALEDVYPFSTHVESLRVLSGGKWRLPTLGFWQGR